MNLMDLREAMGLTTAQVAEELGVPRQDVEDSEETGSTWLLQPFIAAFPINPEILKDENIDPFLDSYVQNTVRDRAVEWREKNGLSIERMAAALEMTAEQLAAAEESGRITRALGTKIEKTVGMNRKWLMYGDGRVKGVSILTILSYALPLIIRFLTKNASSQTGAQSLLGALTQHTSTETVSQQPLRKNTGTRPQSAEKPQRRAFAKARSARSKPYI